MGIHIPPLPLSYRSRLLQPLMTALRLGECCSVIGIEGTGKSNLCRFIERLDAQQTYWQDTPSWLLLIDSHSLILGEEKPEYNLVALLLQNLIAEAERRKFSADFLDHASALYSQLGANASPLLAFQSLQNLCKLLCQQHQMQLVFVFDQFEDLWESMDARFFLNLRSLRDQFKYQVVYLVVTRERLQNLRPDARRVEAFWELFSAHTYYIGPYDKDDAAVMVKRLAARAGIAESAVSQEVISLSGRHPGLLRAIFWAMRGDPALDAENLPQVPSVYDECEKIWHAFSQDEQEVAWLITQNSPLPQATLTTLNTLRLKEVVVDDPPRFFSPLFTTYIEQKIGSKLQGVVIDPRLRRVWLDGQILQQNLSPLEFSLLEYLVRHTGIICKREDLLHALYNELHYDKYDQRLYTLLSRLREALGENPPRYLLTHRGGGLLLTQGAIINDTTE